ncbi:MAG: DUF6171 family protein [Lachnospiraceae bacterium]|nr:DUF6171 family protein [Lachnospiraceae bacterium]
MEELLRSCKQCFIYKEADEKLKTDFAMLINGIPKNERVSPRVYDERLGNCAECDFLLEGTCRACGCFVELRAASKASKCPKKKW